MNKISSADINLFRIALPEIMEDAKHGAHTHFELITVTITLQNGTKGTGYTYTGGVGGNAIAAMLEHDLTPFLIGQNAEKKVFVQKWYLFEGVRLVLRTSSGKQAVEAVADDVTRIRKEIKDLK